MLARALRAHRRARTAACATSRSIGLTRALTETLAAFPVYRTYLRDGEPRSRERRAHDPRCASRRRAPRNPSHQRQRCSTSSRSRAAAARSRRSAERSGAEHVRFALRFQQLTGPVMAKAVEDTAFYRYNRLVCLNEVGGSTRARSAAAHRGVPPRRTPSARAPGRCRWSPRSTHDTKRGEDAAARIAVLSEMPDAVGARGAAAGASSPSRCAAAVDERARARAGARVPVLSERWSASGRSAGTGASAARGAARAAGRVPAQGERGGQAGDLVGRPERRLRGGASQDFVRAAARERSLHRGRARASASASRPTARSTGSRRPCCGCARPACPTPIRAASCGTRAWSIPTTAAPVDFARVAQCLARSSARERDDPRALAPRAARHLRRRCASSCTSPTSALQLRTRAAASCSCAATTRRSRRASTSSRSRAAFGDRAR